jgi:predicted transposase YdaD
MTGKINDLEKSITVLMNQAGIDPEQVKALTEQIENERKEQSS